MLLLLLGLCFFFNKYEEFEFCDINDFGVDWILAVDEGICGGRVAESVINKTGGTEWLLFWLLWWTEWTVVLVLVAVGTITESDDDDDNELDVEYWFSDELEKDEQ